MRRYMYANSRLTLHHAQELAGRFPSHTSQSLASVLGASTMGTNSMLSVCRYFSTTKAQLKSITRKGNAVNRRTNGSGAAKKLAAETTDTLAQESSSVSGGRGGRDSAAAELEVATELPRDAPDAVSAAAAASLSQPIKKGGGASRRRVLQEPPASLPSKEEMRVPEATNVLSVDLCTAGENAPGMEGSIDKRVRRKRTASAADALGSDNKVTEVGCRSSLSTKQGTGGRSAIPSGPATRSSTASQHGSAANADMAKGTSPAARTSRRAEERTQEELLSERSSITKLFMVSETVASIFCSLPHDQAFIDKYLEDVDQAVPPSASSSAQAYNTRMRRRSAAHAASKDDGPLSYPSSPSLEVAQRILAEESADHLLCIHVRDMEQLVPPSHLLSFSEPTSGASSARGVTRSRGSRRARRCERKVKLAGTSATAASSGLNDEQPLSLSPLERVKALQEWKTEAQALFAKSQKHFTIPASYHAITRVRYHNPHKADVTVIQGCGCSKSVEDVLTTMAQQMKQPHEHRVSNDMGAEEMPISIRSLSVMQRADSSTVLRGSRMEPLEAPSTLDATAAMLSSPFALKPLLTVFASCFPRREPLLGSRYEEGIFLNANPTTNVRATGSFSHRRRRRPYIGRSSSHATYSPSLLTSSSPEASTGAEEQYQTTLSDEELVCRLRARGVPPMPRYLTRITVLIEHDELEPVDLLSLAEISTARRDVVVRSSTAESPRDFTSVRRQGKKRVRIYCLVVDGGEL